MRLLPLAFTSLVLLLGNASVIAVRGEVIPPAAANTNSSFSSTVEALGMLVQVVSNLQEKVATKDLSSIHSEDMILNASLVALLQQANRMEPSRGESFKAEISRFSQIVARLHLAGDTSQATKAAAEVQEVTRCFGSLESYFPQTTRDSARESALRFVCPVHSDVVGSRSETCPKCGARLDQMARILPAFCGLPMPGKDALRATITTDKPVSVGQPVTGSLELTKADGATVYASDLLISHGERIHLLIVDDSLTDYHHEHPVPAGPGKFSFPFTARKPGNYHAWAEVRAQPIGFQEYVPTTIQGTGTSESPGQFTASTNVMVEGLRYELIFDRDTIYAGRIASGTLRITDENGKPFTQLEPVMQAFVHLVGFYDDRKTILHIHPKGGLVTDSAARGGPEFQFQFLPPKAGFLRFFAQTQIGGRAHFAPFTVRVRP
jgi:hypothetical protein